MYIRLRPFTIQPFPGSSMDGNHFQIPIIGYEVMEERARFTVSLFKIVTLNVRKILSYDLITFLLFRYTNCELRTKAMVTAGLSFEGILIL